MKKLYGVWFKNNYEPLAMLDIKLTDKTLKPYEPVNTYILYKALFMGAKPTDIRAAFVALKKGAFPNVIKKILSYLDNPQELLEAYNALDAYETESKTMDEINKELDKANPDTPQAFAKGVIEAQEAKAKDEVKDVKSDTKTVERVETVESKATDTKKEYKKPVIEIKDEKSIEKACQSSAEVKADEKTETEIKTPAKFSPRTGTKGTDAAKGYWRGRIGMKSATFKKFEKELPKEVTEYALKANTRLQRKFFNMPHVKGKNMNVAASACAREMACFVWGLITNHYDKAPAVPKTDEELLDLNLG